MTCDSCPNQLQSCGVSPCIIMTHLHTLFQQTISIHCVIFYVYSNKPNLFIACIPTSPVYPLCAFRQAFSIHRVFFQQTLCKIRIRSYIVSNPRDCSKCFKLHSWRICSVKHHLDFGVKHPATLQLMHNDYSYTFVNHYPGIY